MADNERDSRVSPWAAQYVPPEEGDEQPEPVNVTRTRKRNNPSVEAYLNRHPGSFPYRVETERERNRKPIPIPIRIALAAPVLAWVAAFLWYFFRDITIR